MLKLKVMNMDEFLQTVNECIGAVKVIDADGKKRDITRQDKLQWELRRRHRENQDFLKLTLEIPNPRDFMKIVYFTLWDS